MCAQAVYVQVYAYWAKPQTIMGQQSSIELESAQCGNDARNTKNNVIWHQNHPFRKCAPQIDAHSGRKPEQSEVSANAPATLVRRSLAWNSGMPSFSRSSSSAIRSSSSDVTPAAHSLPEYFDYPARMSSKWLARSISEEKSPIYLGVETAQ